MTKPPPTSQIAVFVTRGTDEAVELLMSENPQGLTIPTGNSLPGEHLTEAALRVAMETTGQDVFFIFRKLPQLAGNDLACFQTSPEIDLPESFLGPKIDGQEPKKLVWASEKRALSELPKKLAEVLTQILRRPE